MQKNILSTLFNQSASLTNLLSYTKQGKSVAAYKLIGSGIAFMAAKLFEQEKPILLLTDNKEEAAYLYNDLQELVEASSVLFFPSSYRRPYHIEETDNANVLMRSEALSHLSENPLSIVVSYTDALFEKVITNELWQEQTIHLKVGDNLDPDLLINKLFEGNFNRVDFVTEAGEFSVRGGIIDVFSFSGEIPLRIEFFDNEIESIRLFDVQTQLSTAKIVQASIVPNMENKTLAQRRVPFLQCLSKQTVVILKDFALALPRLEKMMLHAQQRYAQLQSELKHLSPQELFLSDTELKAQLSGFQRIVLQNIENENTLLPTEAAVHFNHSPQPSFNQRFDQLLAYLQEQFAVGFTSYIACSTELQVQRFGEIFRELGHAQPPCQIILSPLYLGFTDHQSQIHYFTDHQILERYHRFKLPNAYAKKQAIALKELSSLAVGDYVTHIDHGIGKFAGLQVLDINGHKQEAIRLIYDERDVLYVSVQSLHKISKYTSKDGKPPKLYKLGSAAWKNIKLKTKARVKEIAFNLIELYAKRKEATGYAFAPDSYLQKELEASFVYEDTPDQEKATNEVKADMESPRPMDRLVCGDVGFGKTEVAIRAAFKAVDNNKQVAVLVPTTILAFQHYKTFTSRLKNMPVKIAYLNRFRSAKEKKQILLELAQGKIDILIGTHQIVNENVNYKNLGLLIIDEEQKFGVGVKDKLKTLKESLDVLTLTATPIPRTLQFSLMAARDLSIISTPPPNRYPIESQIITLNEDTIRDAIVYELQRGGQVYFIHNRVDNIKDIAGMLSRLVPDAKIGVGHGQMDGKALEELMLAFIEGAFDILVATTIIESGLDVPNANTIFIHNANNFGLSDLHQMRGRVGRSNKKAFCYFITPPLSTLTNDARKRMQAIAQFSELGSGIHIAMKDLEIRGAGDLLGGEQSGFINDIGFDAYQKILQEAVQELKEKEFSTLYHDSPQQETTYTTDTQIDTDFELLLPDFYVNSVRERLSLYNALSQLKTPEEVEEFEAQLTDRFGKLPKAATDLLTSIRIKFLCGSIGVEKLLIKNQKMTAYFIADPQSGFFQSPTFAHIIKQVQVGVNNVKITEKQTAAGLRLMLNFEQIRSVDKAIAVLKKFSLENATSA